MKYINDSLIIIWISITLTILSACGQIAVKQDSKEDNSIIEESKLTIDTFSTFPPEIDGCSCYFSNDSTEFKKGQYIYMNDYAQTSFLKINGVLTKFTQKSFEQIDSTTVIAKSTSDNYDLTIEVKDGIQNGDETWLKSGTISLTDKNGKTISKIFYGECGC